MANNIVLTGVVCERCGFRFKAPKNCVWPCGCSKCTGDAAPSWWFRENNPDQKAKSPASLEDQPR